MKKQIIEKYWEMAEQLTQDAIETQIAYGGTLPTSHILMMLYAALHKGYQLTELDLKQILIYVMEGQECKHQNKD